MTEAARILSLSHRRVALAQAGLGALATVGAGAFGPRAAIAAALGASAALVLTWRLAQSLNAATPGVTVGVGSATTLYLGAGLRFLGAAAFFAVALGLWHLPPLGVLVGFALAQGGLIAALPTFSS